MVNRLKLTIATGEPKNDTKGLDYFKQLVIKGKYTKEFRKCWLCGKSLMKKETSIHHIIPKFYEPVYNFIIPLCYPCHIKIHNNPNLNYALKSRGENKNGKTNRNK